MSLRTRLFLLFGGLLAVLLVAEWTLARSLTRELSAEMGEIAFKVGCSVVSGVVCPFEENDDEDPPGTFTKRVIVKTGFFGEGATTEFDSDRADAASIGGVQQGKVEVKIFAGSQAHSAAAKGARKPVPGAVSERNVRTVVLKGLPGPPASPGSSLSTSPFAFDIALDEPANANFLLLQGPNVKKEIPIPRGGVKDALNRFFERLLLGSLALLCSGLALSAFVAHRVTAPLRDLASAARSVGAGARGVEIPVTSAGGGEISEAIGAFNRMSRELKSLDEHARTLQAREHLTELGEVARGLAHTLRNPLNALGLSVEELATRPPDDPQARELVESAKRQIRRVDRSIRSFLALASEGCGAPEPTGLFALVQDVALEALQDGRGRVKIEVLPGGEDLRIWAIPAEIRAAVQALVVNAVEASADAGNVRIRVVRAESGSAKIEIEDEGEGIPPDLRPRLFTPHVTTKASGSGMGLFLAHRIATGRYGGRLSLADRNPRGTLATLELGDRSANG